MSSYFFFNPSVETLFPFSLELYLLCIFKISFGKAGAFPSDFSSVSSVYSSILSGGLLGPPASDYLSATSLSSVAMLGFKSHGLKTCLRVKLTGW